MWDSGRIGSFPAAYEKLEQRRIWETKPRAP
jgi:hypothetical protein